MYIHAEEELNLYILNYHHHCVYVCCFLFVCFILPFVFASETTFSSLLSGMTLFLPICMDFKLIRLHGACFPFSSSEL